MLIGIAGIDRVGKDTVAGMIANQWHEYNWELKMFAAPIKNIVAELTGQPLSLIERDKKWLTILRHPETKKLMNIRELLRFVGEDYRRKFGADVWVNRLMPHYRPRWHNWIIKDVRKKIEVDAIFGAGGCCFKVVNDRRTKGRFDETNREVDKLGIPLIRNHGTLDELEVEVFNVINPIFTS